MTATLLVFPAMAGRLPNRIRELREARGLLLKHLAPEIGCGTTHLSDMETGKRELSYPWMQRIARALAVRPADLLLPEDLHDALTPEQLILLDRFNRATPDQLDQLLRMTEIIVPGGVPLRKAS